MKAVNSYSLTIFTNFDATHQVLTISMKRSNFINCIEWRKCENPEDLQLHGWFDYDHETKMDFRYGEDGQGHNIRYCSFKKAFDTIKEMLEGKDNSLEEHILYTILCEIKEREHKINLRYYWIALYENDV